MKPTLIILLKIRRKQIIMGTLGALLISSFFVQFYVQAHLANPLISGYLLSSIFSAPRLTISGSHITGSDNTVLNTIENESNTVFDISSIQLQESINGTLVWAESLSYHQSNFQYDQNNLELSFRSISTETYSHLINTTTKDYYLQHNAPFNSSEVNSLNGIIFVKDGAYSLYQKLFFNKSVEKMDSDIRKITITNNKTDEEIEYSILIFPLSKISKNLWLESINSKAYSAMTFCSLWPSDFSILYLPEYEFGNLIHSNYFSEQGMNIYFGINFLKEKVVDRLYNSSLSFSSDLSFTIDEVVRVFQKHQTSILSIDNEITEYKRISSQTRDTFLIIQFIFEIPLFLFIIFSFKLLHTNRNSNYKELLLDKLYMRGYSRLSVLAYYFVEWLLILLLTIIIANLFSLSVTAISLLVIDWQDFWKSGFNLIVRIFYEMLWNVESKFIVAVTLLISDFNILRITIFSLPEKPQRIDSLASTANWDYKIIKRSFKIIFIIISVLIVTFSLILTNTDNLIKIGSTNYLIILLITGISLFLVIMLLFVDGGIYIISRLYSYLSGVSHIFSEIRYFLISKKNQKTLIYAQIIALVALVSLSTFYQTFIFNGRRDTEFIQAADIRIESDLPVNQSYLEFLSNNYQEIERVTAVFISESNLGTEFASISHNFFIFVIDPDSFFNIGYFENKFFTEKTTETIKEELKENNSVLLSYNDLPHLENQIEDNLLSITGYTNETRNELIQWNFNIVDYYKFWPGIDMESNDTIIQMIMSQTTYTILQTRMQQYSSTQYWIDLKPEYKESVESINLSVPSLDEYTIYKGDIEHPFLEGFKQVFVNAIRINTLYIIILTLQTYLVFIFVDLSQKRHEIGIFRSMGVSVKQSVLGQIGYLATIAALVILPFLLLIFILVTLFAYLLSPLFILPLIVVVDGPSIGMLLITLLLSVFTPLMFLRIFNKPTASLLKFYE